MFNSNFLKHATQSFVKQRVGDDRPTVIATVTNNIIKFNESAINMMGISYADINAGEAYVWTGKFGDKLAVIPIIGDADVDKSKLSSAAKASYGPVQYASGAAHRELNGDNIMNHVWLLKPMAIDEEGNITDLLELDDNSGNYEEVPDGSTAIFVLEYDGATEPVRPTKADRENATSDGETAPAKKRKKGEAANAPANNAGNDPFFGS